MKSKNKEELDMKEKNVVFTLSDEQFEILLETIKSEKKSREKRR